MRLTADCKATVVRGLRWQTRRFARAENEARDCRLERRSVLPQKAVVALHPAFPRLQDAEALILVDSSRHNGRLLADDSFADDLGIHSVSHRVVDQPAPCQQLRRQLSNVLDADKVGEDVVALRRLGVVAQINRTYRHPDAIRFLVEESPRGHRALVWSGDGIRAVMVSSWPLPGVARDGSPKK